MSFETNEALEELVPVGLVPKEKLEASSPTDPRQLPAVTSLRLADAGRGKVGSHLNPALIFGQRQSQRTPEDCDGILAP